MCREIFLLCRRIENKNGMITLSAEKGFSYVKSIKIQLFTIFLKFKL